MTRFAALIALLVCLSACGANDASQTSTGSPTSAGPTTLTVSGTVWGNDIPLSGASVTVMDGIHAGQVRDATNDGHYSFTLTPSVFTLQAAGGLGFTPQNKTVNLTTTNQSVSFQISDH